MVIGIGCAFIAIRTLALASRFRGDVTPPGFLRALPLLALWTEVTVDSPKPRRPGPALELGALELAAAIGLLVLGNEMRLWQRSRLLDDLLICLEVGVGVAGINGILIGLFATRRRLILGIQDRPLLSASFSEFWARRWNHLVSLSLERAFFRPLARRGRPVLGIALSFAASGLLHVVPVLAMGPWPATLAPALVVFSFFAVNGALVLGERALGLAAAPDSPRALRLARVRFCVLFVALSPLLLDVYGDICGIHGRSFAP